MSNSLDSDQARRSVEPDLGPNCLPRLSADDTGRQRVKEGILALFSMVIYRNHKMSFVFKNFSYKIKKGLHD